MVICSVMASQRNPGDAAGAPTLRQPQSHRRRRRHHHINQLYELWRECYATALNRGIGAGTVRKSVAPDHVAAVIVAAQMGIWGTGKSSRSQAVMRGGAEGLCD